MTIGTPTVTATMSSLSARAIQVSVFVPSSTADTRVTVRRVVNGFDSTGEPRFYVRGFIDAATSAGTVAGYDVDFPQNQTSIQYIAVATDSGTTTTSATTSVKINDVPVAGSIDLGADYILGTSNDAKGVAVQVGALDELRRPARVEVMKPIGRRDAVVVADRRGYPEMDLTVWTLDAAGRQALEDLLMQYSVVTFSPRYPAYVGPDEYAWHLAVKDLREIRASHLGIVAERAWVLSAQQIGAPATPRCTSIAGW